MIKKVSACIAIVFLLSGFGWGKTESKNDSWDDYGTSTKAAATKANKAVATKNQKAVAATNNAATANKFPSEALKALASGTPEERTARVESLKRLSTALAKVNQTRG
jgi:predicted alpha/beta hydrolase family esterase